jgi:hypothetical protein
MEHVKKLHHYVVYLMVASVFVYVLAQVAVMLFVRPSHNRNWELGQEALPQVVWGEGSRVAINNFRNFEWQNETTANVRYETRTYDLATLSQVDVFISHFDDFEGLAHIFLSFGFADGEQVVVSLESRREVGESFSPLMGTLRQYEIIYVVGSEEDIVGLRTNVREDERVYLYPTKATPDQARQLFRLLAEDINAVYTHPRMYNTVMHNCTNELTRRVEDISDVRFPFTWKTLLPGYFDEVLYQLGIIDTEGTFAEIKDRHRIDTSTVNPRSPAFSRDLRMSGGAL